MKDSSKDDNTFLGEGNIAPREESIERRDDRCNALHTLHTLHEKRDQVQVRMRRSLHKAFMKYCAVTDMTAGQFYEQAGILFMDLNPPPEPNLLVVSKPEQRTNLRDRMMNLMCVQELGELTESLRRYREQGLACPTTLMERLCRVFDKCYKVVNPSDELNMLVEEALRYVE